MNIIMMGAQGTGKGTVAGIISEKTGWPQISTGDIFRKNLEEKTELGIEAGKYINDGNLVPDEITVPMVANRLNEEDAKDGFILDGFPRTIEQAEKLDEILNAKNQKIDMVINLTTPREETIERILTRRVCSNQECKATYNLVMHPPKQECGAKLVQRKDDSSRESINKRLEIYDTQTAPLVEYYTKKGVVRTEEVSVKVNHLGNDVANEVLNDIKG